VEDLEVGNGILGDLSARREGGIHDERREYHAEVRKFVCLRD
jgi:hypothetical protein